MRIIIRQNNRDDIESFKFWDIYGFIWVDYFGNRIQFFSCRILFCCYQEYKIIKWKYGGLNE